MGVFFNFFSFFYKLESSKWEQTHPKCSGGLLVSVFNVKTAFFINKLVKMLKKSFKKMGGGFFNFKKKSKLESSKCEQTHPKCSGRLLSSVFNVKNEKKTFFLSFPHFFLI